MERLKEKVRQHWNAQQSGTSTELRDRWRRYLTGWWGYYRLAEDRKPLRYLEGWIRRHIRKCFWQRWHGPLGRRRALRKLGVHGPGLQVASSGVGAWRMARSPVLHWALSNQQLRRYGFLVPTDLAG